MTVAGGPPTAGECRGHGHHGELEPRAKEVHRLRAEETVIVPCEIDHDFSFLAARTNETRWRNEAVSILLGDYRITNATDALTPTRKRSNKSPVDTHGITADTVWKSLWSPVSLVPDALMRLEC